MRKRGRNWDRGHEPVVCEASIWNVEIESPMLLGDFLNNCQCLFLRRDVELSSFNDGGVSGFLAFFLQRGDSVDIQVARIHGFRPSSSELFDAFTTNAVRSACPGD